MCSVQGKQEVEPKESGRFAEKGKFYAGHGKAMATVQTPALLKAPANSEQLGVALCSATFRLALLAQVPV